MMFDGTATQQRLVAKGFHLTVDGVLGPLSFAALVQRAHGPSGNVPLAQALGTALAAHLDSGEINTPMRVRHFLAQAACETWGFTRMKEVSDGSAYEGRASLGNTQPGDGLRFIGRGLLDTTGRWNYQHLHDLTGLDCIAHPEVLEMPDPAVQAAVSFWNSAGCNAAADANDIETVTRKINGGLNGLSDREIYFMRLAVIASA